MARFVYAIVACISPELVFAFPGSMLPNGWSSLPQQIHRVAARLPNPPVHLPENIPESSLRLSFPDQLRNAVMCCKAMTAECLACATNQDVVNFCANVRHLHIAGCRNVIDKAKETSREQALDGVFDKVVEKAAEVVGGGQVEQIADDYLEKHPGVARKSLVNLTSEAFDSLSYLKDSWLLQKRDANVAPTEWPNRIHTRATADGTYESVLVDEGEEVYTGVEASRDGESPFGNPWVLAVCALLVTAVSSGIAVGALCHARIQTRAREPLLSTLLNDAESQITTQA